jgi:hypothetical protein
MAPVAPELASKEAMQAAMPKSPFTEELRELLRPPTRPTNADKPVAGSFVLRLVSPPATVEELAGS